MGIAPPVKDDMVRVTGHHSIEKKERVTIRQDEFAGTRKIVTHIRRPDKDLDLEADVFGVLDSKGYIVNELIQSVNLMCMNCTNNVWLRVANKTFWIEPSPIACVMLGKTGGPPPGESYDCGKLSVREICGCPHCGSKFRITDGIWSIV